MRIASKIGVVCVALFAAMQAWGLELVTNGDFSSVNPSSNDSYLYAADGGPDATKRGAWATGWTMNKGSGVSWNCSTWIPGTSTRQGGSVFLQVGTNNNLPDNATITQNINFPVDGNYRISYQVICRQGYLGSSGDINVDCGLTGYNLVIDKNYSNVSSWSTATVDKYITHGTRTLTIRNYRGSRTGDVCCNIDNVSITLLDSPNPAVCYDWASVRKMLANGYNVKLGASMTVDATNAGVSGNRTLDLAGYTVTVPSNMRAFCLSSGSLTLNDSGSGGKCTQASGTYGYDGGFLLLASGSSKFYMNGGTLTGFSCNGGDMGGVITVRSGCTFEMNGGTISNSSTTKPGGGIGVASGGAMTMNGGMITNCTTTSYGGGIYRDAGSVTINGGRIVGCQASSNGGGVYSQGASGSLVIRGGEIRNNVSGSFGGGVIEYGTFTMYGGLISGNSCSQRGGGLCFDYSGYTRTIYGGVIVDNTASGGRPTICNYGGLLTVKGLVSKQEPSEANFKQTGTYTVDPYVKVGNVWVVGRNLSVSGSSLAGGTFTFDPSASLYTNAGLSRLSTCTVSTDTSAEPTWYTLKSTNVASASVWRDVKANLEAGTSVKLTSPITQDYSSIPYLSGSQDVTLDLNGKTLTQWYNNETATWIINASGSAKVKIKDSVGGGQIVANTTKTTSGGSGGGALYFVGSSSLTLESGTLKNFRLTASGKHGGCIYVGASASFTMNGGMITNCTSSGMGGAVYSAGTVTMNGGTISGCTSSGKGGAAYNDVGTITITGGTISGCTATAGEGGAVYTTGGIVTMSGGKITGNSANGSAGGTGNGGGVALRNSGTFNLSGGEISNNTSTRYGGGIAVIGGILSVTGGTIAGNTSANGGAIECDGATASIYGGVIRGTLKFLNTNTFKVYGVVADSSDFDNYKVSGKSCTQVGSMYVVGTNILSGCGALVNGTYTFCPTNAEYVAAGVAADLEKCEMTLDTTKSPTNYVLTAAQPIEVASWSEAKAALEAGNSVKLMANMDADSYVRITSSYDLTIDMNGKTVTRTASTRLFNYAKAKIRVTDSVGGGCFTAGTSTYSYRGSFALLGGNNSTFVLDGDVTIDGFRAGGADGEGQGGAFAVESTGSLIISNGVIRGCSANTEGGAVYAKSGATVTMVGGTITNCTATSNGGAVYSAGTFTMNGGVLAGNTASNGGAVYTASRFEMFGGEISGNTVTGSASGSGCGGGVAGGGTKVIYGGRIVGNTAARYAGGIFNNGGTLTVYGGTLSGNTAPDDKGGAIDSDADGQVTFYGGVVTDNVGGNFKIEVTNGMTVNGGAFDDNPTSAANVSLGTGCTSLLCGDNYVVGSNVLASCGALVNGTYTFCPTNDIYSAAGVTVDVAKCSITVDATKSPTNYVLTAAQPIEVGSWSEVKSALAAGMSVKVMDDIQITQQNDSLYMTGGKACDIELDLNGHTIDGYNVATGGEKDRIFVISGADAFNLTLSDSVGGGAFVGHSTVSHGGAFAFVGGACKLTINDVTIRNFTSLNSGGAIYVATPGTLEMTGGMITNCATSISGGAIWSAGSVVMTGGTIVGNRAETLGGGIHVDSTAVALTLGGDLQIVGNTVKSAANNVYLASGKTIAVSPTTPLAADAKIGVTTATAPIAGSSVSVTGVNAADVSDFFFSDNTAYYADNGADNAVRLALVGAGPTVKDKDKKDVVVEIPTEWRQEQKATPEEVMKPNRKMKNGHPAWQNYVLGIDPTNELSSVYADAPQNKATDAVTIETKNITQSKVASGYAVKYRLDKKLTGASEYTKGEKQDEPSFDVLLNGDDPSGVYKLNTVIVKDGVELDQPAEAVNTIGLVKATNTNKFAIVAVPWSRLAPGEEEEIAVSNVLKTATLEAGDKLHVFNRLAKTYDTWTLNAQKEWDSVQTFAIAADGTLSASVSGASATETIARGSGIWLERMNPTNAPYFLYGQVSASELPAILPGHNLVGAPGVEAFDFSRVKGAAEGDQILVPGVVPKLYELKNGVWGYSKTVAKEINVKGTIKTSFKAEWTTTENTIPAGTGFWLINKSGNTITIE